jgi:alpha-beta hydrolase superfamily lysophospholipase
MGMTTDRERDLELSAGRLHAQRFGAPNARQALAVHGLSANMHGFEALGERLAARGLQVVAVDLRARGRSEVTPPGTLAAQAAWGSATSLLGLAMIERGLALDRSVAAAVASY